MTKEVFCWVSYGELSLYECESLLGIKIIYNDIVYLVNSFGDEEYNQMILDCSKGIREDEHSTYKRAISMILDELRDSDLESFEYNTGFKKIESKS